MSEAPKSGFHFRELVADDRVLIEPHHGRLIARAPKNLAGLLEIRGVGILRLPFAAQAQLALVTELLDPSQLADRVPRLPEPEDLKSEISGIELPYLRVAADDPAICDIINFAMEQATNHVENVWQGLAETDDLVLSRGENSSHHG